LVIPPVFDFGYLTITVDMTNSQAGTLTISYRSPNQPNEHDSVVVSLASIKAPSTQKGHVALLKSTSAAMKGRHARK
jgi:hypothetical protein